MSNKEENPECLFLYVSCRGVTKTKLESDGQTLNNTEQIKDEKDEFASRK